MKEYKIFTLLRTLSKKELAAFNKYIKQKHANDEVAVPIFYHIRKFHPFIKDKQKLTVEYINQKVLGESFENKKCNRKKILNAFSDLYLWLKEFLLLERLKVDFFSQQTLWLNILKDRGLETEFSNQANRFKLEMNNYQRKGIIDYMRNMSVSYFYYNHCVQGLVPPDIEAFQKCSDDLDLFYKVSKLKLGCEIKNLENLFSINFDIDISTFPIEENHITEHPLLLLYSKVFELVSNNKAENYFELEEVLSENASHISTEEIHIFYSYLHNYAAGQIRMGKEEFWEKIHYLNKLGLKHKVFTRTGVMSPVQFNNIVNIACKVEDFVWVRLFIMTQSKYLKEDLRKSSVLIAKANILFEQGAFEKALHFLEKVHTNDTRQTIRMKAFVLRCHFELIGNDNILFDYCNAFEAFLQRNRKPKKEIIEATLNFVRFIKILVRKKIKKDDVLKKLNNTSPIYFKNWLYNKALLYKATFASGKRRF